MARSIILPIVLAFQIIFPVALMVPLANNVPSPNLLVSSVRPANAIELDIAEAMKCVTTSCGKELSTCLVDSQCAAGMRCFIRCAVSDVTSSSSSNVAEGACQTRCMDIYQNQLLDDFTECTLTDHSCYPALKADVRYPPIRQKDRTELWQDDLLGTQVASFSTAKSYLQELFHGRWLIAAGLNPTFDIFDCQVHEFFEPVSDGRPARSSTEKDKRETVIADATFSYRIPLEDGKGSQQKWFTKRGDKRLTLVEGKDAETKWEGDNTLRFDRNKKWGIDSFLVSPNDQTERNSKLAETSTATKLVLTLQPHLMKYRDEWIVLASSTNTKDGFVVTLYRGTNTAWEGYGGLNIYTRTGTLPEKLDGIERGLAKVGLTLDDLTMVDNSCTESSSSS